MEQTKIFCEHSNSAFTRVRKPVSNPSTEQPRSDIVSKTLTARQSAFREIKRLFGVDKITKSVYPSNQNNIKKLF